VLGRDVPGQFELQLRHACMDFHHQRDRTGYLSPVGSDTPLPGLRKGFSRQCHCTPYERKFDRPCDCTLSRWTPPHLLRLAVSCHDLVCLRSTGQPYPLLLLEEPERKSPCDEQAPEPAFLFSPPGNLPLGSERMGDRSDRTDDVPSPLPGG